MYMHYVWRDVIPGGSIDSMTLKEHVLELQTSWKKQQLTAVVAKRHC